MTGERPRPPGFSASSIDRREFLARVSATALLLGGHQAASLAYGSGASRSAKPRADGAAGPRILSLELETATSLEEMAAFYGEVLGLPVRSPADDRLAVAAGATEITFVAARRSGSRPFYHFAFNIPEHKILAARAWQLERTPLFLTPENLRDPDFPDDVRHFRTWNAHSVFFWDPAGNVLEYIARHDLESSSAGAAEGFSSRDILYASEIAFVVDDVPGTASRLEDVLSLPRYRNAYDVFHATGDERGLLLLFARGREIGDRLRDRPAAAAVFPTRARIRGTGPPTHDVAGYPYAIDVAPSPRS